MYNILMFTPQDILEGMIEKKFYLMYQPIFFHDGVTLYGIEVLLRLKKNNTKIPPTLFINIAEDNEIISLLTLHLIDLIITDDIFLKSTLKLNLHINISPASLLDKNVCSTLVTMPSALPENIRIVLEITERIPITDITESIIQLKKFKENGLLIALDDYGKGYSTDFRLNMLPVDYLKLDRNFYQYYVESNSAIDRVYLICKFCDASNIKIIAEGIENKTQYRYLVSRHIGLFQGFYFSKPLNSSDIKTLILHHIKNHHYR